MRRAAGIIGFLCMLGLTANAGEYTAWSPGIQVELNLATGGTFVPFQSASGNIQGASVKTLYGLSMTNQIRAGELLSWKLRAWIIAPSIGFRLGRETENRDDANLLFFQSNGSLVNIQDAHSRRKTETRELFASLPVRWYPASGSAIHGGFYIEAGPVIVRTDQTVDLNVTGLMNSVPANLDESAKITATEYGILVGLGRTRVYRGHQFSYGIDYRGMSKAGNANQRVAANLFGVHLQWTW